MPGKTRAQRALSSIPDSAADKAAGAAEEPGAQSRRGRGAALEADAGVGAPTGISWSCWWPVSRSLSCQKAQCAQEGQKEAQHPLLMQDRHYAYLHCMNWQLLCDIKAFGIE